MNSIATVYLAYLWVGLLHAVFVGVTLYAFWGKWLRKQHQIVPIAIMFSILAFFELYWIPMFSRLGISIFIKNEAVHQHFGIDENTNLVSTLRPSLISYVFGLALLIWLIKLEIILL